jgi:hypothetical protein
VLNELDWVTHGDIIALVNDDDGLIVLWNHCNSNYMMKAFDYLLITCLSIVPEVFALLLVTLHESFVREHNVDLLLGSDKEQESKSSCYSTLTFPCSHNTKQSVVVFKHISKNKRSG